MERSSQKTILEARQELMMSKIEEPPTMRLAHFIKPSASSQKDPIFQLPLHSLSKPTPVSEPKNWPLEVNFAAWRFHLVNWKDWVDRMASTYKSTWEKVGIYEPIMSSTYIIRKDSNLILGLAEKWCPGTNTFVFSWGEVTITLEDLMVSGYSVLGSPVFSPLKTEELKGIEERLNNARLEMHRSTSKKASHSLWLKQFMDSGSEIEHEAFLALWLSRYIFPNARDVVGNNVFSIAIHLARGIRIALAPAVLASIYRDLSLLKSKIIEFAMYWEKQNNKEVLRITMWSPFQLMQIWALERFTDLKPRPNYLNCDELRLARWHKLNVGVKNVRLVLDSSKDRFDWRPYGRILENRNFAKFYGENEMLMPVHSDHDEELESFARCLRVSRLVGLGFVKWYFPHRVAMQFGFDQDLPGCVNKQIDSPENAWREYSRPITDVQLYIPSRIFKAGVTTRYADWWKLSMKNLQVAREGVVKKQKILKAENEEGKLLSETIFAETLKQSKDLKNLKKFEGVLKRSKRAEDGVGISRSGLVTCETTGDNSRLFFSKKRKISETMEEDDGLSLPSGIPKMSSKDPSRKNCRDDSFASMIALRRSKISGKLPLRKCSTKELAGSLKRKMDGEDAQAFLKTSKNLGVISKTDEENASGSPVRSSKIENTSPLISDEMQNLINSPFPPGFPPKSFRVEEAMDTIVDELTIEETVKPQNKRENIWHKESGNVVKLSNKCPSQLTNHSPKCSLQEASDSNLEEDEMTVKEMWDSCRKPEFLEKSQGGGGHVLSNELKSHSSSMADSMNASTEIVPDSGDENSSGQPQNHSSSAATCCVPESPQFQKTTMVEVSQFENVENKQVNGYKNSLTQTKSHSSLAQVNDPLSGDENPTLIHSEKPHHRNLSFDCTGSKLYQQCLETEARLRRVEKMISELKVAGHRRQSK